jgi:alginate O-acetyltransferase complex protein AlgI
MTFTSWQFGLFVAIVFGAYYLPALAAFQTQLLVFASLFFYGYGQPELLPLLAVAVFGTYLFLILALRNRSVWLPVGIVFNLALLAFFKYKFLFIEPTSSGLTGAGPIDILLRLPLPIGISFFVFHNISLLVDLTRQKTAPSLAEVFLYIIFFPQLVSGPITRAEMFMPQIKRKYLADVPFVEAAKWILIGFFFKLYVANNLNEMTSYMDFPRYETLQTQDRWLLIFLYSYQIYADFFGYSAIAIGLALLFGYRLPVNFDLPYISKSFSEFWSRWHMSLSNWLRTYLYVPLGGNRLGAFRTYLNLMIVMGLGGWTELPDVGLDARRPARGRAAFPGTPCIDRFGRVSDGAHVFCFPLCEHALDFLQAAELRSRDELSVRHVRTRDKPEPAEAVL